MAAADAASSDANAPDVARTAGRGGLAVAFAKIYFIAQGLVQQVLLPRVLGLSGYGAWSTVNSIASVTYNPIVSMSIQGVSRAVADAPPEEQEQALRSALKVHAVLAVLLGGGFALAVPSLAAVSGAPHVTWALLILSGALFLYSLYAPLIGALNGKKRFTWQAGFDVLAATLRTAGLVVGAWWLGRRGLAVEGAALGFVIALTGLTVLCGVVVGTGRAGASSLTVGKHLKFILPVLLGQVLLNLLLQADLTLLRRFAAESAVLKGLPLTAADPLVGAYRATQLFSFLPYQLLIAVNFILFPMLATAVRDQNRVAIAEYVATGVRIALLIAGLMVSVTAGLSTPLLRLVFGPEAAELGGRSLQLLALGFGAFAIFGVLTTVLNSLKCERESALVTGAAVVSVAVLCFMRVRGSEFGEVLLFRTASATAVGLAIATTGAALLVRRAAGAVVAPLSVVRVVVALGVTVTLGRFLPMGSRWLTPVWAAALGLIYLSLLVVSGELGRRDLATLGRVFAKRKAP